jgi:hypothetical protein
MVQIRAEVISGRECEGATRKAAGMCQDRTVGVDVGKHQGRVLGGTASLALTSRRLRLLLRKHGPKYLAAETEPGRRRGEGRAEEK